MTSLSPSGLYLYIISIIENKIFIFIALSFSSFLRMNELNKLNNNNCVE